MQMVFDVQAAGQLGQEVDFRNVPKHLDKNNKALQMTNLTDNAFEMLRQRKKWQIVVIPNELGSLVTCDNPVSKQWMFEGDTAYGYPTLSAKRTWVYMPLGKQVLLVGSFEDATATPVCTLQHLAELNTMCLMGTVRNSFSSGPNFIWSMYDRIATENHFLSYFDILNCVRGITTHPNCPLHNTQQPQTVNPKEVIVRQKFLKRHVRFDSEFWKRTGKHRNA